MVSPRLSPHSRPPSTLPSCHANAASSSEAHTVPPSPAAFVLCLDPCGSRAVAPNVVTYTAAISACQKGWQWERAVALLADMQRDGVKPNTITYNALLSACAREGRWEEALALLQDMKVGGCPPDMVSFNAAHEACQNAGRWEAAGAVAAGRDAACDSVDGSCEWPEGLLSFNAAISRAKLKKF